jgi:hypothetical protein
MSFEAQLQSLMSWAIPRYVEAYNKMYKCSCRWAGYTPASANQSVVNPSSFGWDFLMMFNCDVAVLLELKYPEFHKGEIRELTFNPHQLAFLSQLEISILVRVCFNTDPEIRHRIQQPSDYEAQILLENIKAVSPTLLSQNSEEAGTNLLDLLDTLLDHTEQRGAGKANIFRDAAARSPSFPARWATISTEIVNLYESGDPPPNLFFVLAGKNGLSAVPGETAAAVLRLLGAPAVKTLRKKVLDIGNIYIECLQSSNQTTAAILKKFHAATDALASLTANVSPTDAHWKQALFGTSAKLQVLLEETTELKEQGLKNGNQP